jgi:LPS O-antigen subunit length determinant protein (WzzB/FepE family)
VSDDTKQTPESTDKPEIRYIPIDYMPGMHDEDEIDLLELAKKIWGGRWLIAKVTGVFILLGLFFALFSPVEYESEAILMPEIQVQDTGGTAGRLLQQFGGAFGLGGIGSEGMPAGTIPPLLYPRIVNSLPFQLELLNHEVQFRDYEVTTTWPDFLENHYPTPLATLAVDYSVKLPLTLLRGTISLIKGDPDSSISALPVDPTQSQFISITEDQQELVDELRERISVSQDEETGLLTTRVKLQDARASAELNRFLIERLKEYVIDYRLEKARQNLEFAQDQLEEAETRFEETQVALAEFQDRNVSLGTARAQIELERLQDEKNLAFNVYNVVAQQVEQARLALQEQTPIFKEVQAVTVPSDNTEPNRPLLMVVFTLVGGIVGIGYIFIVPMVSSLKGSL